MAREIPPIADQLPDGPQASFQENARNSFGAVAPWAAAAFSVIGLAAAVEGVTPHPPVNPTGSKVLIETNQDIRDYGPYALLASGLVVGAGGIIRRRRPDIDAEMIATRRYRIASRSNLALTAMLMATTAAGSALGEASSTGANFPVRLIAQASSQSGSAPTFVEQHSYALPLDHSEVTEARSSKFIKLVQKDGGRVMPYSILLGDMHRSDSTNNPSTSAIDIMPASAIKRTFNVSMPESKNNCDDLNVITNKQLGASVGENVVVEGHNAKVAKTFDAYPGLDRAVAVASLEEMQNCVTEQGLYNGLAISGISTEDVQYIARASGLPYSVESASKLEEMYSKFWEKSVDPPQMQLVMYLWLASLAGMSFMKIADVMMRRRSIAALNADGAQVSRLAVSEYLRAGTESVKAAGLSAVPALALTAINASSQFGIAERFDLKAVGAGLVTGLAANLAGATASSAYIGKMKMTAVERA